MSVPSKWTGVGYKVGSCLAFSCLNVAIKSSGLPGLWVVCLQNTGAFLWTCVCLGFRLRINIISPFSLLRSAFFLAGLLLWTASLKRFSLFQTISMGLFSPCATVLLAFLVLKESLTWRRSAAIAVSTFGGLLIHYGKNLFNLSWIELFSLRTFPVLPFLATFSFAVSNVLAKKLLARSSPEEVGCSVFALTALGACVCLFIQCWYGPFIDSSISFNGCPIKAIGFWKDCIVLGSLTFLSHILMNRALSIHRVIFLIPFGATRPVVSAFLGWYFFKEPWPSLWMWVGSSVMIGAIIVLSKKQ